MHGMLLQGSVLAPMLAVDLRSSVRSGCRLRPGRAPVAVPVPFTHPLVTMLRNVLEVCCFLLHIISCAMPLISSSFRHA